jgi:NAD(P)-dependent dehydrogenase (short-subunit alcohol dehydrogenase family)
MGASLRDQPAVVTGGGRGIGRGIAMLLAAEGAAVVVNDLGAGVDGSGTDGSPAEETVAAIVAAGGRAIANHDDVGDFQAAENLVATAVREWGRLDILVNNAGILRDRMIFNLSEEDFDAVVRVHLKGTFNCSRHASRQMREQKWGRIISMSSTSGLYGNAGQANYGAAKDGITGLTRVISRDLGKYGITVNAIAPGAATRMTATMLKEPGKRTTDSVGGSKTDQPRRRFEPEDIAPFAVYLATDAAANINGQTFAVMGGVISLLNDPAPVRTITKATGTKTTRTKTPRWTPEEIAALFPSTLGRDLVNPAPRRQG